MSEVTKAIVLARGLGKRLRASGSSSELDERQLPIANLGIKALMPILGDKTLLEFILENLSKAGFSEICLVIGHEHQLIRDFCAKLNYSISFAIQDQALGTANAVLAARDFTSMEKFIVVNSDNLYSVNDLARLRQIDGIGLVAYDKQSLIQKSNIDEAKINKFAVLDFDAENILTQIVEKPEMIAVNAFISMNAWLFSPKIFAACESINLSPRGEFELADAVNFAISQLNEKFRAVYSNEGVLDLSSRADVGKINERLSSRIV